MGTTSTGHLLTDLPIFLVGAGALGLAAVILAREDFAKAWYADYLQRSKSSGMRPWWMMKPDPLDDLNEDGSAYQQYKHGTCAILIVVGTMFVAAAIYAWATGH